ncbi:hypothetical protein WA026_022758, partial [Henosepilachna vigintioctopunctata]
SVTRLRSLQIVREKKFKKNKKTNNNKTLEAQPRLEPQKKNEKISIEYMEYDASDTESHFPTRIPTIKQTISKGPHNPQNEYVMGNKEMINKKSPTTNFSTRM